MVSLQLKFYFRILFPPHIKILDPITAIHLQYVLHVVCLYLIMLRIFFKRNWKVINIKVHNQSNQY